MQKPNGKPHPSLSVRIDIDAGGRIGPGKIQLLETIHRTAGAGIKEDLVDRDSPYPDGTCQQAQHDRFDDPVSLQE